MAQQPLMSQGLLIIEDSRSRLDTPHSVGLLWTSDQPDAENSDNTQHSRRTSMPPAGFETATPASERPQTYAVYRAATGISIYTHTSVSGRTYIIFLSPSDNFRIFFLFHFICSCFTSHPSPLTKGATKRLVSANASSPVCTGCRSASLLCQIRSAAIYSNPYNPHTHTYIHTHTHAQKSTGQRWQFHPPKSRRTLSSLQLRLFSLVPGRICNGQALGLYVQVTVHRDKLRIKQPTRCIKYPKFIFFIKLYMFRASSVPIIRSYLLYARQLARFMQVMRPLPSRVRFQPAWNVPTDECTVDNSWWWPQKMLETCRVLWQNKF